MKIKIICVGKIKEAYLEKGIQNFLVQIGSKYPIEMIELPDEKTPQGASPVLEDRIKDTEGKRILSKISPSDSVFALCIEGKQYSTSALKARIEMLKKEGKESIAFIIGGSLGLSPEVVSRSKDKISFSSMTFPHQLMRLILLEQLSRVLCE